MSIKPYIKVEVTSLKRDPNYVKCPRCWHYHACKLNFMSMCDRCCYAILEGIRNQSWDLSTEAQEEFVQGIREAYEVQRKLYEKVEESEV